MPDFPGEKGWNWDDAHELNPANRLALISLGLPGMRRFAIDLTPREPGPEKDAALMQLIHMAQETDAALEHWYNTMPEHWGFRTVRFEAEEPKNIYRATHWQGPIHVYDDLFIANIVNDYRVSRIFCQQLILNALESLWDTSATNDIKSLQDHAQFLACSMANDICSSVPFHLEIKLQPGAANTGQESHGEFTRWFRRQLRNTDLIFSGRSDWRVLPHVGALCCRAPGLPPGEPARVGQRPLVPYWHGFWTQPDSNYGDGPTTGPVEWPVLPLNQTHR